MRIVYVLIGLVFIGLLGYLLDTTQMIGHLIISFMVPVLLVVLILRLHRATPQYPQVRLKSFLMVIAVADVGVTLFGKFFKALHWPGASIFLLLSMVFSLLLLLTGLIYLIINRRVLNTRIALEFFIIMLPAAWYFSNKTGSSISREQYSEVTEYSYSNVIDNTDRLEHLNDSLRREADKLTNEKVKVLDSLALQLKNYRERIIKKSGGYKVNGMPVGTFRKQIQKIVYERGGMKALLKENKQHYDSQHFRKIDSSSYLINFLVGLENIREDILLNEQNILMGHTQKQ